MTRRTATTKSTWSGPVMHFARAYGGSPVCGHRNARVSSPERAQVTCSRCLARIRLNDERAAKRAGRAALADKETDR